jgi:hypothetical protein
MSEFVWNEKLVREFLRWFATSHSPEEQEEVLAKFKASKQPKPEWEILEIKGNGSGCIYRPSVSENGVWVDKRDCGFSWTPGESIDCSIHAVKRLSDNQIFTIGDELGDTLTSTSATLDKFEIHENKMYAHIIWGGSPHAFELKTLTKAPKREAVYLTPSQIEKLHTLLNTTPK